MKVSSVEFPLMKIQNHESTMIFSIYKVNIELCNNQLQLQLNFGGFTQHLYV